MVHSSNVLNKIAPLCSFAAVNMKHPLTNAKSICFEVLENVIGINSLKNRRNKDDMALLDEYDYISHTIS